MNLYELKLLESIGQLRDLLSKNSGRSVNLRIASDISICLQQGRSFFESAGKSSLEISPLLIFYGMFAFSKAVILARGLTTLDTLPQSHGLKDVTEHSARLDETKIKIEERGTFQKLNDVVRELEGLIVSDFPERTIIRKPTSKSEDFSNKTIDLREILARIPNLQHLYSRTFDEDPKALGCGHFSVEKDRAIVTLNVSVNKPLPNVDAVKLEVEKLRTKFQFLKNWIIYSASDYGELSGINFCNINPVDKDEFSESWFNDKILKHPFVPVPKPDDKRFEDISQYVDPISGILHKTGTYETAIIEKFSGLALPEMILYYLGMFALGSLVRYRPNHWVSAIRKTPRQDGVVDDKAMALIENFIDKTLDVYPTMVVNAIREPYNPSRETD